MATLFPGKETLYPFDRSRSVDAMEKTKILTLAGIEPRPSRSYPVAILSYPGTT
jgi:hypothetical protein